jgi:hypothetical protein
MAHKTITHGRSEKGTVERFRASTLLLFEARQLPVSKNILLLQQQQSYRKAHRPTNSKQNPYRYTVELRSTQVKLTEIRVFQVALV